MFDMDWMADLDGEAVCAPTAGNHRALLEREATQIYLAVHWADLYNGDARDATGRLLPGMERARRLGAAGTPRVLEFAHTEFAALQDMHPLTGQRLIRDGLNLRHRHPRLWARIRSGQVRVWAACKIAQQCAALDHDQALWVDAATAEYSDTLSFGRFQTLVAARIIEVDPDAEEARRRAAEAERFVRTGQCNAHGLKTLVAKAQAGDVIWFVAMADRIATILAANGDPAHDDPGRRAPLQGHRDPGQPRPRPRPARTVRRRPGHHPGHRPTPQPRRPGRRRRPGTGGRPGDHRRG